jgi:zinc protease
MLWLARWKIAHGNDSHIFESRKRKNERGTMFRLPTLKTCFLLLMIVFLVRVQIVRADASESVQEQGILRATLKNGLSVVIIRNSLAPVVATMVNYLAGSDEAPEGFPGMAHAQEHMMFRGSPGLTANQLSDIIAAMGGMFDADTQQMVTQYFLVVPAEDLDVALHIEAIRMRGVLDKERLWKEERGAIEQEVAQDLSDPEYVFYTRVIADMFKGIPFRTPPLAPFLPSIRQPEPCSRSSMKHGMPQTTRSW